MKRTLLLSGLCGLLVFLGARQLLDLEVFSREQKVQWLVWTGALVTFAAVPSSVLWLQARKRARRLQRSLTRLGVYRLEGTIASGGMGTVYKAQHALLKRPTAIKIARDPAQSSYFEKEVVLTSRLTHPNTVLVYDYGKGQDGSFYYAMEHIEGYDLQQLVDKFGPIPEGRALRLLLQVVGSLTEAHERGIVHRDIKPSNIMITERGGMKDFVKVLDFGLARQQPEFKGKESLPSLGGFAFAGTPGYLAPEVVAGTPATILSDIFSLGAVAYFLLSGAPPFAGTTMADILTRALGQDAPPLPQPVTPDVERLIRACLNRDPTRRPRQLSEINDELRRIVPLAPPWTSAQIESWWAAHPPENTLIDTKASLTFLLKNGPVVEPASGSRPSTKP